MPTPQRFPAGAAERADLDSCRRLLSNGSKTFYAASFVLPKVVRDPATALYAFCRLADDAVDLSDDSRRALDALRVRLDDLYAGRPQPHAADRAFAAVVERYALPRELPEALLEGFAWDASGRRYQDLPALYRYATRVAGTVGAMMAVLMGVRAPALIARACDLGVAMQLTNIARDVGEDARNGRVYLPCDWLADAGIDVDAWLRGPVYTPALGRVVRQLLIAADVLYRRADAGIARLPTACRPGMRAARLLYAEIGRELLRRGPNSVDRRAVVPRSRKLRLLGSACAGALLPPLGRRRLSQPPLDETRYLVDAVDAAPVGNAAPVGFSQHLERLLTLMMEIDRRRHGQRIAGER